MTAIIIVACILALLGIGYLLTLAGRNDHPELPKLRGWAYAHRGLHGNGVPENSMAAFRAALEHGYGIELDIHLTRDGKLAVIHDSSLMRTAGADVTVEDLTFEELKQYRLEGTEETIPLFSDVLALFGGRAPMIVELKSAGGNFNTLTDTAVRAMEGYPGVYCMESFDPRCLRRLKKCHPRIIRGQLSENFLRRPAPNAPFLLRWIMTNLVSNVQTRPDFIAYNFADRNSLSVRLCRKLWGIQGVSWTLRSQADFDTAVTEGYLPIFEGFQP